MVSINCRLFSRLCDPVLRFGLFHRVHQMDAEIFQYDYENWRRIDDCNGNIAVYRSNDQNYNLAKPVCSCKFGLVQLLGEIVNCSIREMLKDALRQKQAERIGFFIRIDIFALSPTSPFVFALFNIHLQLCAGVTLLNNVFGCFGKAVLYQFKR